MQLVSSVRLSRGIHFRASQRLIAVVGLLAFLAVGDVARADDADQADALVDAQLRAGEFGPALNVIQDIAEPAMRDALLERMAVAQARAGARGGSLATLAAIDDDRARTAAIRQSRFMNADGQGGGVEPDFDQLIDLITLTIEPESWDEMGGEGAVAPFEGGVHVDAAGVMHRVEHSDDASGWLESLRREAMREDANAARQARAESVLRKVSLVRLERAVQLAAAAGEPLDEEMLGLAGLRRVRYVFVYPEAGDLVLAGPAGDWTYDDEGRLVSAVDGAPLVRFDDLVVLLRNTFVERRTVFGCSIEPRRESLAAAQTFLASTSARPLTPQSRGDWLNGLRDRMGLQDVIIHGVDPHSRVARVLVEADHHMKLVGMGLAPGTLGVPSYLQMITIPPGGSPPPMNMLRWWFAMDYEAVTVDADRQAFELRGQGVRLMSENELLKAGGERVATGESDALNREFARNFTEHFELLAQKYPLYADLRNIFDLALVASMLESERLPEKLGWHMSGLTDAEQYAPGQYAPTAAVETVVNHRVVRRKYVLAGVSGGVRVDPARWTAATSMTEDASGRLASEQHRAQPDALSRDRWWWD